MVASRVSSVNSRVAQARRRSARRHTVSIVLSGVVLSGLAFGSAGVALVGSGPYAGSGFGRPAPEGAPHKGLQLALADRAPTAPHEHSTRSQSQSDHRHLTALTPPPVREPGLYDLRAKGASDDSAHKYAVNINPAESDLKPQPASEVQKLAERYNAGFAENFDAYQRLDRSRRHGSEFWQPFLLALLALLFIEVLLAQRIAKG